MKTVQEMHRSWLVQRLSQPLNGPTFLGLQDNPFSFGGGLRNGGLSDDAMGLLRGIFQFDYMGSAEFEFGAVPKALQGLAKDAERLVAFEVLVDLSTVPAGWRQRKKPPITGTATVYVLCRKAQRKEVTERVHLFAARTGDTKESVGLDRALRPEDEYDTRVTGWLELDNGFFFFTDRVMWSKTCSLFGVAAGAVSQ